MGAHSCGLTCNWVSSRGPRRCACARRCVLVMQCRAVGPGGVSARRRTWQSSRVRQTSSAVRRPSRARVCGSSDWGWFLFTPPLLFGSSLRSSLAIASTPFPALLRTSSRRGSTPRQEARPNLHPFIRASARTDLSTEYCGDHCKRITVCVRLSIYIFSKVVGSTHEHSASMLSTSHGPNLEAHTPNTITSPPHASRSLSTRRCRAEGGGRQAILPTPPWGRGARRRGAELRPLLLRSSALQHAAARRRLWDARRALGSRRRL